MRRPDRLCARRQLTVQKQYPALLPPLLRQGLGPHDALAVAYNTTLLFYALPPEEGVVSPRDLLDRLSLGEIAALCREQERAQNETKEEERP